MSWLRVASMLVLIVLALLGMAAPADAHTFSVAHVAIQRDDADRPTGVEIDLAIRDLALTLPLDADRDERVTWGELRSVRDEVEALVLSKVSLSSGGLACRLIPQHLGTRAYDDGAYATLVFAATCSGQGPARLRYELFFDRDPRHRALITIRQQGKLTTALAHAQARSVDLDVQGGHSFVSFLREGVHHILIGYDHLAFLLSLLLPAALVRKDGSWRPAQGLRAASLHIAGIVTAFTLAHSLTLGAAALGWITPASRWVEAAIAMSVLLAALNNIWPLVTRRLWMAGFAFGLVHGFGFAGALSELGLPRDNLVTALLGFNLGVEAGQLAVVAALMPVLYAVRRQPWYPRFAMPAISLAIAALAGWWLVERLG